MITSCYVVDTLKHLQNSWLKNSNSVWQYLRNGF